MKDCKYVLLTPPQLKDNDDLADNTYVDTKGWGLLEILIMTGAVDADLGSTAETTAPLVEQCDTNNGQYAALTGAALADPIDDEEDKSIFRIAVDLIHTAHKRFMRVQKPHSGDGTSGVNAAILARLSSPQGLAPDSATDRGLAEDIIVGA